MTHRFSFILLLWLLLVSPQLAACSELAPYPVKDSGMLAPDTAQVIWLDNARLLFNGYRGVEYSADDANKVVRYKDSGYYIWDTEKGTVQRDTSFDGKGKICVHGEYLSYIRRAKDDDQTFLLVSGKKGEVTERPYPKTHWFNPLSCRYYDQKPFWIVEGHQTIPLLEEHGYLDLGTRPEPDYLTLRLDNPNPPINFYSVNAKKSFTLPIGWQEVGFPQVHYAPFSNRYLLSGLQYYDEKRGFLPAWPRDTPPRVWWLKPDGSLEKEELPNISPLQGNPPRTVPIRTGLFVVAGNTRERPEPTAVGGYLIQGQHLQRVINGMLLRMSVSPDGCKVAVVNDTHEKKPVSERIRLQIIQFCQGD